MVQYEFLVHFSRTLCISLYHEDATVDRIKQHVESREGVPSDRLDLFVNGTKLTDDTIQLVRAPSIIRARMREGLLGGKGGFGAMLRSQGKGSGKATSNFGACRDLNGRRLRHVNQEIAMQKWKGEKETREQQKKMGIVDREIMDEETPSGIPGWYLATPSWAEGIKKSYMKRRRNTILCRHWLQARSDGQTPPLDAPRWWGCPRGRECDFAHGEEELRGEGLTEWKKQKKEQVNQTQQQQLEQYVNYEKDIPDDIYQAIRQGLSQQNETQTIQPVSIDIEPLLNWLVPVQNSVQVTFQHGLCELRGKSNFGTAMCTKEGSFTTGKWCFEVKIVTNGVIQVGWAGDSFTGNSEAGDGVGDCAHSWAYDGCRQLKWTNGQEYGYGDEAWKSGDVIGVLIDLDDSNAGGMIQFARNGQVVDSSGAPAFTGMKKQNTSFFPAISLNQSEVLLVNIGVQPLLYPVDGYQPVYEGLKTPSTTPADSKTPSTTTSGPNEENCSVSKVDVPSQVDLETFQSAQEMEDTLGLEGLKRELQLRRLKCGGTLTERAARLWSVRGKAWEDIDMKLKDRKRL